MLLNDSNLEVGWCGRKVVSERIAIPCVNASFFWSFFCLFFLFLSVVSSFYAPDAWRPTIQTR